MAQVQGGDELQQYIICLKETTQFFSIVFKTRAIFTVHLHLVCIYYTFVRKPIEVLSPASESHY